MFLLKFTSKISYLSHFRKIIDAVRHTSAENKYRTRKVILLWAKNMVKNKP